MAKSVFESNKEVSAPLCNFPPKTVRVIKPDLSVSSCGVRAIAAKVSRPVWVKYLRIGEVILSAAGSIGYMSILFWLSISSAHQELMPAFILTRRVTPTRARICLSFFHIQSQYISPWDTAFNMQVLESSICSCLRTKGSINEAFIGYINNHLRLLLWEACDIEYH